MRTEEQVLEQILSFAKSDANVRQVVMNGSRINPNAPRDILQDYDIVFFLKELTVYYKEHRNWIAEFGELVMLQQNDCDDGSYIFLMQFKDGVRIDLYFQRMDRLHASLRQDSLSKILLDKDSAVEFLPEPSDKRYHVKKPTQDEWAKLMNNIWWIQTNIAKGIWRDELPYVKYMYDVILMDCVQTLLSWYVGAQRDWAVNIGKCGKWLYRFLNKDAYAAFISLYPATDYTEIWNCLFRAGVFIRTIGTELGKFLGYPYPLQDDINVSEYIRKIRVLPLDATSFK